MKISSNTAPPLSLEERVQKLETVAHTPKGLEDMTGFQELLARLDAIENKLEQIT
jgi:tetrahydromethanopterin S-methyltransferase subunit G